MAEKYTAVKVSRQTRKMFEIGTSQVEDEIEPNTPPPYMDPANAQYKKKMSRIREFLEFL